MAESSSSKRYDLEERTLKYASRVRSFLGKVPRTISNIEDIKQVVRASGSIGANYIEANESLSRKDFLMRIKISRKEAKECEYWLKLIDVGGNPDLQDEQSDLTQEAKELMMIFSAIMRKSEWDSNLDIVSDFDIRISNFSIMISDLEQKFEQVLTKLQEDLALIRTGRASAALVENLKVPVYGSVMILKELASIAIPEPRQILITPWDKTIIADVEKALRAQNFSPAVEETMIRVVLPPLTGEEREKIIKEVGVKAEEAKVSLRMIRRDAVERVEAAQENKEISEDEEFSQKKRIDELLEYYNRKIEVISQDKKSQLEIQ